MARQENIWLLFEQVRLCHLMIETAGRVVEVLVGEKVDIDAALVFVYLGNLGGNVKKCEGHEKEKTEREDATQCSREKNRDL